MWPFKKKHVPLLRVMASSTRKQKNMIRCKNIKCMHVTAGACTHQDPDLHLFNMPTECKSFKENINFTLDDMVRFGTEVRNVGWSEVHKPTHKYLEDYIKRFK